ncbi:MAG: glycosyltransferase [Candidatus Woesearchaeota archaeon]
MEKGDKLRAYNFIKYLSRYHEIYLFAISDCIVKKEYVEEVNKYCKSIKIYHKNRVSIAFTLVKAFFTKLPFQVAYFYCKRAQKQLDDFYSEVKPDKILCQLIRVGEYAKDYNCIKILDYMDAFSKGIERRIKTVPFFLKPIFISEYKRLINYEQDLFSKFEHKIIISESDRNLILHKDRDQIKIVQNGVDFDNFTPLNAPKKYDILFVGNMSYPPNVAAVMYLANEILPLVKKSKPDIKLLISGANPVKKILRLKSKNIEVTGWVKDMRDSYAQSKIMVAPLNIGTGLQNKILQAMAMKVPCITSELVNSAINAVPEKEVLIARTPSEYSEKIITLLDNPEMQKLISENAYIFVQNKYQWAERLTVLNNLIINT